MMDRNNNNGYLDEDDYIRGKLILNIHSLTHELKIPK